MLLMSGVDVVGLGPGRLIVTEMAVLVELQYAKQVMDIILTLPAMAVSSQYGIKEEY